MLMKPSSVAIAITMAIASSQVHANEDESGTTEQPEIKKSKSSLIERIEVTAQKRLQSADDIGMPIAAFSSQQMKDLGINNAIDITKFTPGVVYSETSAVGVPIYTIRGVGFDDYSTAANSTVGIYVDEVSLPYPIMTRGLQFDVQRVEILKGPQGDLYGRNSTGGAFNFISNKPTQDFELGVNLEYGSYQRVKTDGFINGGLTNNLSARFSFATLNEGEGWQTHAVTGEDNGAQDQLGYRLLVNWDLSSDASLLFNVHGGRDKSENSVPQAFAYRPLVPGFGTVPTDIDKINLNDSSSASWGVSDFEGTSPIETKRDSNSFGASVTLDWALNDNLSLTSITAYEEFDRKDGNDWDGSDLRSTDVYNDSDIQAISQELRLSADNGEDFSWIVGAYASSDSVKESFFSDVVQASNSDFTWIAPDMYLQYVDTRYEINTKTAALYGHTEWDFAEDWTLILGARYTAEERELLDACTYDVEGALTPILGTGPGDCGTVNPETGMTETFSDELSVSNLSGKVGINYKLNQDVLLYGLVSNGFKSGGYQGAHASSTSQWGPYDEEILNAAELGFKSVLLNNTMKVNASVFNYWYKDKQVQDTLVDPLFGPLSVIINLEESEIRGAEIEWVLNPLDGLDLRVSGTWLDTEVIEGTGINLETLEPMDLAGQKLTNSPELQWSALISYEAEIGDDWLLRSQLDGFYSDSSFSYLTNDPELNTLESYTVANLRFALLQSDGAWEVSAFVRNLTDESYYTSSSYANDIYSRSMARPRTFGVGFSYSFY
ncbi:TonB-dependent receptor [Shewanella sediminis HAW-EB3]|uniref:TonB-dependent receptor n=1 Tax=Shewanella sediminis (strain HAW-EB3) TaxID=425104 RepID=A8FVI4_SHESH|nr:TonB-dependent receptor [Shewanella sediminis]ABV36857.1 TonB-dependent receptor [Shewanella sediminis HAW-EB3]